MLTYIQFLLGIYHQSQKEDNEKHATFTVQWLQCSQLEDVYKGYSCPGDTGSILNLRYHCWEMIIISFLMQGLFA